jgi:hypothetical protein
MEPVTAYGSMLINGILYIRFSLCFHINRNSDIRGVITLWGSILTEILHIRLTKADRHVLGRILLIVYMYIIHTLKDG